ncbi:MAG: MATE family efflux transporter [Proteobacteria bacterium]|nr:MATE family efflux transporter [Pseudomonadota bacterium]
MNSKSIHSYFANIKSLLILSLPLMVIQVFNQARSIVDVMMVGHVDEINLAGLSLASSAFVLLFLFVSSFSFALIAVFSELYAKKDFEKIRFYAQQSIYFSIIGGILLGIFFMNTDFLFAKLNIQDKTKDIASSYLQIMGFSSIFACAGMALKSLMQSFVKNNQLLLITAIGFALNIPLNMIFIYGVDGLIEPMYAKGAAIATGICFVFDFVAVGIYCAMHEDMNPFKKLSKIDYREQRNIINLGFPVSLGMVMEVGLFVALAFLVSKFGETVIGANQIAINFTGLVFMFSLGVSMAVMQRVSFLKGLGDTEQIKQTVVSSLNVSLLLSLVTISLTLIFKTSIVALYTDNAPISAIAIRMLTISIAYQLFDSLQTISLGILRAYKLNKEATKMAFVCYWIIGILGGEVLSRFYGVYGYWMGLIICFMIASVLYYRKVYTVVWLEGKSKASACINL